MATMQQTLAILDNILAHLRAVYPNFQRVRADCIDLLRATPSLSPQRGQCVRAQPPSNIPHTTDLLKITGPLRVVHNNMTHDVPIEMWIPEVYPHAAPICKIPVAQAPPIKQLHYHVDAQGNIYVPYLTYWNPVSSNLLGVAGFLTRVFTDDFPFVLMPTSQLSSPPGVAPEPYTPSANPMHYYSTPLHYAPQAPGSLPLPDNNNNNSSSNSLPPADDSLPLPFAPARQSPQVPSATHSLPSPSVHTPLGMSLHHTPDNPYASSSSSSSSSLPPYSSTQLHPSQSVLPPQVAPPQPALPPPPPEEEPSLMSFQRAEEDPFVLRNNLLRSLTERTQQRLKSFFATTTQEVDELMETNQTLKKKLHDMGNHRLNEALDLASKAHQEQQRQLDEANAWLAANDKGNNVNVDEVTEPKDPLQRQLFQLIAEDAAYDDAYYQLEQLMASGKIDLQAYLKTARTIAREQFLCRALWKKVHAMLSARTAAAGPQRK